MAGVGSVSAALERARPLVLIVQDQDWCMRALESVIVARGYDVRRANSAARAWQQALERRPDAILLDVGLADGSGIDLCRRLRGENGVGMGTPILMTTAGPAHRSVQRDALAAGAWAIVQLPPESEAFLARLSTFIAARRAMLLNPEHALVDPLTGFYNAHGMLRRSIELGAQAARFEKPLACIVFDVESARETHAHRDTRPAGAAADAAAPELLSAIAAVLRETVRRCDAVGRIAATQFAVIAPETDDRGAVRLIERLRAACRAAHLGEDDGYRLHAASFGAANFRAAALDPALLLDRAAIRRVSAPRISPSPMAPTAPH